MTRRRACAAASALLALLVALLFMAGCRAEVPQPRTEWLPAIALEPAWTGLSKPVQLTHAGDGSGRAFVVELDGAVRVIEDGAVRATPFLDVSRIISTGGERGLFSIAFPPDHTTSGRFYIDYTDTSGDSIVARYRLSKTDPSVADPSTAEVVLKVDQPYANHNGGQIAFGPDGYLYVGFGDGGGAGDPDGNGQDPGSLLGKMLRIDVSGSKGYTVPGDNPFLDDARFRPEVWALGLRNPWRFSFDTSTGDLYIADVGQNAWEEIDVEPAGAGGRNYGWNLYEGTHPYARKLADAFRLTMPVVEYGHAEGVSVTGGHVYRGSRFPDLDGVYFYGDYGSGRMWALARNDGGWRSGLAAETGRTIAGFGQDEDGEVYALDMESGDILRIVAR